MLRVKLVLGGNGPEFAATRIYTVPSAMMPVAVQMGVAGPPGGQPGPSQGK